MAKTVVAAKAKSLPPWLQKVKGKDEEKGEAKGKPFVDGGNVKVKSTATNPKGKAQSNLPKAKSGPRHMADGGKAKKC